MADNSKSLAPLFLIEIEGKQLPENLHNKITKFVFEDCDDQDDLMEVHFSGGIDLIDENLLQEGKIIKARWGYEGNLGEKRECIIKQPEYSFAGSIKVTLKAYDAGSKMKGKSNQKIWKNKTYSGIVGEIAKKYKMKPVIDSTTEVIINEPQGNKSDFEFVGFLANKIGFQFFIQNTELHFHKINLEKVPVISVAYQGIDGHIISFKPKIKSQESKGQGTEVKAVGFDPMKKEAIIKKGNDGNADQTVLGSNTVFIDGSTGEEFYEREETGKVIATPHQNHKDVDELAKGVKRDSQLDQLEATLNIIGVVGISAKEIIEITNVGVKFTGNYYIKKVRHEISSGYRMSLSLKRNAVGKTSDKSGTTQGQENKHHGELTAKEKRIFVNPKSGIETLE